MDAGEFFKPASIYAFMAWRFPICHFLSVALSELRYIFAFDASPSLHLSSGCWYLLMHSPLAELFSLFRMSFFLYCFILSRCLFSLPSFAITFWFIFSSCIVCFAYVPFSFRPNTFMCSSSVLSFLLMVVDLLSAFPVEFPIQVLSFHSCNLVEHWVYQRLISLLHSLVHLIPWCPSLRYELIGSFFSVLTVFQSWILSDGNLVFFSYIILFTFSIFLLLK